MINTTSTTEQINSMKDKAKYRIVRADRTIKYAGTDHPSWFTLERAKQLVNREAGEMIYEHDGVDLLWEVL